MFAYNDCGLAPKRRVMQYPLAVGLVLAVLITMSGPAGAKQTKQGASFKAIMEQAELMRKLRKKDEALKLYQQAVKLRPKDSEAHAALGWILFELRRVDEAIQEQITAINIDQRNANAYHHLGAIYLSLNMLNEAADQFRMSLSLDPGKKCNCGPIEALIMTHPPGGAVMTPEEADRVLGISPAPKTTSK